MGWYKQLGQRVQDASTVSCRGRKGFRSMRRLCGGYRHPSRVAPGLFCRTRGGTRCTCAPPRCWPASLGWGHTAATGCWSAPRTRRRWGSSCSAGCLGRCRRPRRLGVKSRPSQGTHALPGCSRLPSRTGRTVGVEHLGLEPHGGRLIRVVFRERQRQLERAWPEGERTWGVSAL